MRRNIATILEMEGFEVVVAEHGRRGVELAGSAAPDLILCDVMMPELDGYGVLKAVRENKATSTIPFVFLTAKGEKTDLRAGMNLGADDYLAGGAGGFARGGASPVGTPTNARRALAGGGREGGV